MKRREFITFLGSAAVAWPLGARAQQPERMKRIGVLIGNHAQNDREGQANIAAFVETLQKLGWIDGRNVRIEYRWGAGERVKAAAAELVRSAPDAIVVATSPALAELKRLTSTIPIVFPQVPTPEMRNFGIVQLFDQIPQVGIFNGDPGKNLVGRFVVVLPALVNE